MSLVQYVADKAEPPPAKAVLGSPKIAVIGAGLTGVSAAAHCIGHGFDATIFETCSEHALGGIWSVRICLLEFAY